MNRGQFCQNLFFTYLFADESGDLGFDFNKPGTTKNFVETVLLLPSQAAKRAIEKAVERTLKHKIGRNRKDRANLELKGAKTDLLTKRYFFRQCAPVDFEIFSVILDKKSLAEPLRENKSRLYSLLARQVIDEVPLQKVQTRVVATIDKSLAPHEIQAFNQSMTTHLQGKVDPLVPLELFHMRSHESKGLQAADMFSWGIFRKYEQNDLEWYNEFAERIGGEVIFAPITKKE